MFKRKNKTKGEYIFGIVNNVFMLLILVVMLYPVINQLAVSLSSNSAVMSGHVSIIPKDLNFNAYLEILSDKNFLTAIKNSALFTVMNTVIGMTLTAVFAYPLSKKHIKGRNTIMALLVFSMMFGTGGLIPNYLLMRSLKLVNTFWALTLPSAISIWNVIVLKNFYQQIPASLEESATVDGASPIIIFIKIILPLAVPSIAALTMFVAISSWNTFFNAIIYLTTPSKKMLQVCLKYQKVPITYL